MKNYLEGIKTIYQNEKNLLILMIVNLLASIVLLVVGIVNINVDAAVVTIGYGDIGGYRSGSWTDMLVFSVLAFLFGILHNFIAIKIFRKRGAGMAKFFVIITTSIIIGAFIVLLRLTGRD